MGNLHQISRLSCRRSGSSSWITESTVLRTSGANTSSMAVSWVSYCGGSRVDKGSDPFLPVIVAPQHAQGPPYETKPGFKKWVISVVPIEPPQSSSGTTYGRLFGIFVKPWALINGGGREVI